MTVLGGIDLAVEVNRAEVLPGDEVAATVQLRQSVDRVTAARVELGYVNAFRYRWAGHRDSTAADITDTVTLLDPTAVGTTQGGDRETTEWVTVLGHDVAAPDGRLEAGPHEVRFRMPSWSPASSPTLAIWAVRATIERQHARDGRGEAPITVLAPAPSADGAELSQRRLKGDAADVDVRLESPGARPGGQVRGTVQVTARRAVKPADVLAFLFRDRLSHPVARRPAEGESRWRTRQKVARKHQFAPGVTEELSFALDVPAEAEPTAETPNASIRWYVEVSVSYKGWTGDIADRVRREVIVFNAR